MSHLQKCIVKIFKEHCSYCKINMTGGKEQGGGGGGGTGREGDECPEVTPTFVLYNKTTRSGTEWEGRDVTPTFVLYN